MSKIHVGVMMQRLCDIFFSSLALISLLPILIPTMIVLRLTGEGEVFYRQARIGRGNKIFYVYKFATMLKNSPNMENGSVTIKHDPRVLPFGKILRKTKVNELPQLINIIIGDMSIIGPRPLTNETFQFYNQNTQMSLATMRPGLSGVGSIIFRDEEQLFTQCDDPKKFYEEVIAPYKGELELWYMKNQTLYTYFVLIGITAWVVFFPQSALIRSVFSDLPKPGPRLNLNI